ncbi:TPA: hypothetical protein ACGOWV_000185 [Streptococcus suis]
MSKKQLEAVKNMKKYATHLIGCLLILCMLFPFAHAVDIESYSVLLVSGWWYFSQNLFSLSVILIFLAFFFINYQGHKNIQLIIFVMAFMATLYFYCLPILALGEGGWSQIIEFPVGYFVCGLLMLSGFGIKLKYLNI